MNIKDLLEIIALTYVDIIRQSLVYYGLEDSRIINNINYQINANNTISILMPEYAIFIEQGRQPYPGRGVDPNGLFVANLIEWIRRKRIRGRNNRGRFISNNQLAVIIARAINRDGIRRRPFLERATNEIEKSDIFEVFALNFNDLLDLEIFNIIDPRQNPRFRR